MLRICNDRIKVGTLIRLPEAWHEIILAFSQKENCPYDFIIDEIVDDTEKKEVYCICKTDKKDCEFNTIVLTIHILNYLLADEVEDSNIGLSFKEYLPLENAKILMTNTRNPNDVVPASFEIRPELVLIKDISYVCLDFVLNFLNGDGFTSFKYYLIGSRKYTWKLILHPDTSYMTDYEKMFRDTLIHKDFVRKSCDKLIAYLEREGATEHANLLRERARVHDNSKIRCEDEMRALSMIINDKSSLTDASKQLSQIKQDAIRLHWKHNSHHPEHFKTPSDMARIDIMEMCCDWYARSMQYNTDFLDFVKKRQEDRFHFPDWMFAEIWHYCQILNAP